MSLRHWLQLANLAFTPVVASNHIPGYYVPFVAFCGVVLFFVCGDIHLCTQYSTYKRWRTVLRWMPQFHPDQVGSFSY